MLGRGEGNPSAVPPPPKDVRIRTMASDIQSMAQHGGGNPSYEKIEVKGEKPKMGPRLVPGQPMPKEYGLMRTFLWVMAVMIVLAAAAYFAYPFFAQGPDSDPILSPKDDPAVLPGVPQYLVVPRFIHESFFRVEADQALSTTLLGIEGGTNQDYTDKVLAALKGAERSSEVIEVALNKSVDQHLGLVELLKGAEAEFLNLEFLAENFNPDFTYYVYREGDSFWPGVIAELKPRKSLLLLQSEIAKLEKESSLENLFLASPGARTGKFKDVLVLNQPARSQDFGAAETEFIYGWFHDFLVISTSEAGLREAVLRL